MACGGGGDDGNGDGDGGGGSGHVHQWEWVVTTPATYTEEGVETETCVTCKQTNGTRTISKKPVIFTAVSDSTFGTDNIFAIAYGKDKFVAGGAKGKMAYSSDGAEWTTLTAINIFGTGDYEGIFAIAYGNGKFVAGGSGGKVAYSSDGATWTAVEDSTFGTNRIEAIAYDGSKRFVAGGNDGKMAYSDN